MGKSIEIIAEIGKNFVISEQPEPLDVLLQRAKLLIDKAKECGAKIVKFQCHNYEDEIHPEAKLISPHFNQDRLEWVKRNTYPTDFWWSIKEYCREQEMEFLATPMSRGAAELLNEDVGIDRWKIGSGDILDFVMLDYIRDSNKPVILSSGMSTLEELRKSYEYLHEKTNDISILHCVSQYPCPLSELNLNTIPFLKNKFPGVRIGLSDHSLGIEGSLMAASLGAEIIEKHFSLSRDSWGPDHKASATLGEIQELIDWIKSGYGIEPTQEALGVKNKILQEDEAIFRPIFRKGLYASRNLIKGEMYEPDMIISLRPQLDGTEPSENYPLFLGKRVLEDIKKYGIIKI